MRLFISYSEADRDRLRPLLDGLRRLGHTVWFDPELSGEQEQWETMLLHIRISDALLIALSPAILESEVCVQEADYARAVGRPILPVMVERVRPELLPPSLSAVHTVDFTEPGGKAAFDLMVALGALPPPERLPDPLPDPPDVPFSYQLARLNEQIQGPKLNLDEQFSLVGELKSRLGRPQERDKALEIARRFRARNDTYFSVAAALYAVLEAAGQARASGGPGAIPEAGRSETAGEVLAQKVISPSEVITGPVSYEIVETRRTQRVVGSDVGKIDNSEGEGTITRRMRISHEWSQAMSIGFEQLRVRSTTADARAKLGFWKLEIQAGLKQAVENHLKGTYSIDVQDRRVHEEEIIVEVASRAAQNLVLTWKCIWQHGVIRLRDTHGQRPVYEIPFEVTVGLTFDIQQKSLPRRTGR